VLAAKKRSEFLRRFHVEFVPARFCGKQARFLSHKKQPRNIKRFGEFPSIPFYYNSNMHHVMTHWLKAVLCRWKGMRFKKSKSLVRDRTLTQTLTFRFPTITPVGRASLLVLLTLVAFIRSLIGTDYNGSYQANRS
jgi:hypothetical protein